MGKWLGLVDETEFGTPVTPPTTFLDCVSLDMHPKRESAEALSTNFIGPTTAAVGSYLCEGDVEIIPNSESIALLLKWMLGDPTTDDDAGGHYKHEYWPSDTLIFGTMYKVDEQVPDGTNALQYTSCIPTELSIEAALNAFVSTRWSMLGQVDAKVAKPTVGTFSSLKQFFSLQSKFYWDITETSAIDCVSAASLTYTREIPDDNLCMTDHLLQGLIPGNAKLEGSLDLQWKSWDAYEKFWGDTSAPIATPARAALELQFIGEALGGTGEYTDHRMCIKIPSCILPTITEPFGGRGKVTQTLEFTADRGTVGGQSALCEMILYNTMTDV